MTNKVIGDLTGSLATSTGSGGYKGIIRNHGLSFAGITSLRSAWPRRLYLIAAGALVSVVALAGCQPEQRPAGSVEKIGGNASQSVSQSVSAPPKSSTTPVTLSPGQVAAPDPSIPSKPDGIYTPNTNREIYQRISADYQEIAALTNQVNEGKPLPAADILIIYEAAKNARMGTASKPMRLFAREAARSQEFPDAVAFYKSATFLDDPIMAAINGTGMAKDYSPAQRRQAIQKGVINIIYHWSRRYIQQAADSLNPGLVDEAWAIYMGGNVDGKYPNSLSAVAVSRETNFNRPGSIDVPLRQAMSRAQKAAADKDATAYQAAAKDVYSRYHAMFYLSAARYLNEALKSAKDGKIENASVQMIEGLSYYRPIQPQVAKVDPQADKAVVDFYQSDPAKLTVEARDRALAGLNRAADALLLKPTDLVTPADFK
ncbi:MAG: hypothetical protein HYX94_06025 [Chloroflexi bacterium]|nr:hypothetical protein [Chloroflexota bacterium]